MAAHKGFAHDTSVSVEKSKIEIEKLLTKHGAIGFQTGWQGQIGDDPGWDVIGFRWKDRAVRFRLDRPNSRRMSNAAYDQRNRQRWRVLALVIKAKLEAVHAGVAIFEEEFLANIVTADDRTMGEILVPMLTAAGSKRLALHAGAEGTHTVTGTVIE
jgi:hypothetical protein